MHILFLFVDGVGLGSDDPERNPFARAALPGFERLAGGRRWLLGNAGIRRDDLVFLPADANLGIDGLPQSGTGQATLFTGVNCAALAGRHYGPYPHSKTREALAERNLFRRVIELPGGLEEPCAFANAYPNRFFSYVKRTDRWTVTTRCCLDAGVRIRSNDDLRDGLAVPADLTGRRWPSSTVEGMMPASEQEAALRLLRIARLHRLTLFEVYRTDKAGHHQDMEEAVAVLHSFDALLTTLLDGMDRDDMLLVLSSDHGNLEDISTRTHTRNPVPVAAHGARAGALGSVRSIEDVTPALVDVLTA